MSDPLISDQVARENVSNLSKPGANCLSDVIPSPSPSISAEGRAETQHTKGSLPTDKNDNFDHHFLSHHLNLPPVQLQLKKMEDTAQISAIEKAHKWSDLEVYEPLGALLTNYSRRIHGVCALISKNMLS